MPVAQAAQEGLERPRAAQEAVPALRGEFPAPGQGGPVRAPAGMHGSGPEPVTRVGQRNAEIQARNRAVEAARVAVERAQRVLEGLERAVRRAMELARGLGAQVVEARRARELEAERQRQERARVEAERRAELEQQERARVEELQRQEAERARPVLTQAQRDAARLRPRDLTPEQAAREVEASREASRRQVTERASRQSQGPSMGM